MVGQRKERNNKLTCQCRSQIYNLKGKADKDNMSYIGFECGIAKQLHVFKYKIMILINAFLALVSMDDFDIGVMTLNKSTMLMKLICICGSGHNHLDLWRIRHDIAGWQIVI